MMNPNLKVNRDAVLVIEQSDGSTKQNRRSSEIGNFSQFFERRRKSIIGCVFGHAEAGASERAEWLKMQERLRKVKEMLNRRSNHYERARFQCVDEPDDDEVPYELMGQVSVLLFIVSLLIFATIAGVEGI